MARLLDLGPSQCHGLLGSCPDTQGGARTPTPSATLSLALSGTNLPRPFIQY